MLKEQQFLKFNVNIENKINICKVETSLLNTSTQMHKNKNKNNYII